MAGAVAAASPSFLGSAGLASSPGLPSGNAVLNLPVSRRARVSSLSPGLKSLSALPPRSSAVATVSTSIELPEDFSNGVRVSPVAGVPVNTPAPGRSRLSMSPVVGSSRLIAFGVSESQVASGLGRPSCPDGAG